MKEVHQLQVGLKDLNCEFNFTETFERNGKKG